MFINTVSLPLSRVSGGVALVITSRTTSCGYLISVQNLRNFNAHVRVATCISILLVLSASLRVKMTWKGYFLFMCTCSNPLGRVFAHTWSRPLQDLLLFDSAEAMILSLTFQLCSELKGF